MLTLSHFLLISSILFAFGLYGVLTRRNAIGILMGIELMLNGVNVNLISFARFLDLKLAGDVFAIFVITVAAAEAVVGLALILSIYHEKDTINVDEINLLKW
jgi:NADH:ubiquinone oxidoreductase subunit K